LGILTDITIDFQTNANKHGRRHSIRKP